MIIDEHKCVYHPSKLLKHSRPCYVNKPVKLWVHEENSNLIQILSRWVKEMAEAGIDVSKYNTHSCGSAPSTGALYKWVHIEDILKQGDWSNLKSV